MHLYLHTSILKLKAFSVAALKSRLHVQIKEFSNVTPSVDAARGSLQAWSSNTLLVSYQMISTSARNAPKWWQGPSSLLEVDLRSYHFNNTHLLRV